MDQIALIRPNRVHRAAAPAGDGGVRAASADRTALALRRGEEPSATCRTGGPAPERIRRIVTGAVGERPRERGRGFHHRHVQCCRHSFHLLTVRGVRAVPGTRRARDPASRRVALGQQLGEPPGVRRTPRRAGRPSRTWQGGTPAGRRAAGVSPPRRPGPRTTRRRYARVPICRRQRPEPRRRNAALPTFRARGEVGSGPSGAGRERAKEVCDQGIREEQGPDPGIAPAGFLPLVQQIGPACHPPGEPARTSARHIDPFHRDSRATVPGNSSDIGGTPAVPIGHRRPPNAHDSQCSCATGQSSGGRDAPKTSRIGITLPSERLARTAERSIGGNCRKPPLFTRTASSKALVFVHSSAGKCYLDWQV